MAQFRTVRGTTLAVVAVLLVGLGSACQRTPPGEVDADGVPTDLANFNQQDLAWSQAELQTHGYQLAQTREESGTRYEYWWHADNKRCLYLKANAGKVDSVALAEASDCGH